eukprot:gene1514-1851_t
MAMIYNLVTAAQEWLAARTAAGPGGGALDPEAEEKRRREEEEAARAAARAHGMPVTSESFNTWRQSYEAEVALQKAQLAEGSKDDKAGRLTGKQWFMQQMAAGRAQSGSEEEEEGEYDAGAAGGVGVGVDAGGMAASFAVTGS